MVPVIERLAEALRQRDAAPAHLQWIRASAGHQVRLIPVEQVHYLRSDEKYTLVAWRGDDGKAAGNDRQKRPREVAAATAARPLTAAGPPPSGDGV